MSPREINARVRWEWDGGRIVGVDAPEELGPVIRDEIARRVPVMANPPRLVTPREGGMCDACGGELERGRGGWCELCTVARRRAIESGVPCT